MCKRGISYLEEWLNLNDSEEYCK